MYKSLFLSFFLLTSFCYGQETLTINSRQNLKTTDSIWVFKPGNYQKRQKYPVIFLLHGHSANFKSWNKLANLQQLANTYNFIIVCPDGLKKSWYINSLNSDSVQYERFFMEELLPMITNKYSTDSKNYFITGASMGGHGAMWLFLNHPEHFAGAGSTSGVLNLRYSAFRKTTISHLLGEYSESNKAYDDYSAVNKLKDLKERNKALIFDSGTEDYLYLTSKQFRQKCDELKIAATYTAQPGGHTGGYWSKTIVQHFRFFSEHLNK
ncbi:esterase [Pedobacter sp. HMWF019]|uniref:alpha/beta hydrolase n=1 Tax=Pedobacter sp. HMWF019 TaxID=2056856 RepID=UPI000D33F845|nr:alpha/beta hydrolase family protein [Pedobacter sp. HMWF019]PTS97690.1 esterase [Pedobacter sp. HMWF019]